MKKLHFSYSMQIDYDVEVSRCNFTIKCMPKENARQRIEHVCMKLIPNTAYSRGTDGLGNEQIYGLNEEPHKTFFFQITGEAVTGLADYEEAEDENLSMIFRHPHGLNRAGVELRNYFEKIKSETDTEADAEIDALRTAERLMQCLHRDFRYQSGSTDVTTTAEEAFRQGCGVCQDYAHIFIALLHLAGIPARYVAGLLIGEGESHAWVEILKDGKWYGLDPTNNMKVTENHIKIGVGRDACDCMINRGIMHGGGRHKPVVRVTVKEME